MSPAPKPRAMARGYASIPGTPAGYSGGLLVGGTEPGAGNLISGNLGDGIVLAPAVGNAGVVQGNLIGTDVTGTLALGNGGAGVQVMSGHATIGGTAPGAGNVIS